MLRISTLPPLNFDEGVELVRRHRRGDAVALDRICRSMARYVFGKARKYARYSDVNVDELVQEGFVGLLCGLKRYDETRNVTLFSYLAWWVDSKIRLYAVTFGKCSSIVRYGTSNQQRKAMGMFARAVHDLGPGVSREDIAKHIGVATHFVDEVATLWDRGADVSIDAPDSPASRDDLRAYNRHRSSSRFESGSRSCPPLSVANLSPEDAVVCEMRKEKVRDFLGRLLPTLNDREIDLLHNRIMADEPKKLEWFGERWGRSRERVRQIEGKLLKRLKEKAQKEGLW